jgi:hypothetical protein
VPSRVYFTQTKHDDQIWGSDGSDWALQMREQVVRAGAPEYAAVDDPDDADIIVFWEPHQDSQGVWAPRLRAHPLVERFSNKVFTVNVEDNPLGLLSGLYTSLPPHLYDSRRHRTWVFYRTENPYVYTLRDERANPSPRNLAVFMGSDTCDVRSALFRLRRPFAEVGIVVEKTVWKRFSADPTRPELKDAQVAWIDAILDAKFSLCPRGNGASSYRLQESMALGRAPVILSDAWVPPAGVDWSECALIVKERDLPRLPAILHEHEHRWEAMGRNARQVYDAMFCRDSFALNVLRRIEVIRGSRTHDERDFFDRWPAMMEAESRRSGRKPRMMP